MALLIAAASLLALAHASGPQASCAVGQQCPAGEQDDTGMLQKSSQMMQVNRHEQMSVRTTPTNDAECEAVPGINTDEPIVYDSSFAPACAASRTSRAGTTTRAAIEGRAVVYYGWLRFAAALEGMVSE
ncbi:unnamed protein product [Prorocentrum cordatum]|uniref:Uncharacterized protein n=1 Tax=Prorocentrum cordatum TaxID=2364126 RepID=A0ABN9QDS8_9DINO|nr:unnamed protein product [Polarella glacialis]